MDKHHNNIICHNCLQSNFSGQRYICCECENFNLCQKCKESPDFVHDQEHAFVKISKPVKLDIKKFKNLFRPNKILLTNTKNSFDISFDLSNIGSENLKGCYLTSIKASNEYLTCTKKVINEDILPGEKKRIDLTINFQIEEDEEQPHDVYEGYFRLFNKEGIPFGDILYLQVITED